MPCSARPPRPRTAGQPPRGHHARLAVARRRPPLAYAFLIDRHNRRELNLAKFGLIAVGDGATLRPPGWPFDNGSVANPGRLGDVQALVLVSPAAEASAPGSPRPSAPWRPGCRCCWSPATRTRAGQGRPARPRTAPPEQGRLLRDPTPGRTPARLRARGRSGARSVPRRVRQVPHALPTGNPATCSSRSPPATSRSSPARPRPKPPLRRRRRPRRRRPRTRTRRRRPTMPRRRRTAEPNRSRPHQPVLVIAACITGGWPGQSLCAPYVGLSASGARRAPATPPRD